MDSGWWSKHSILTSALIAFFYVDEYGKTAYTSKCLQTVKRPKIKQCRHTKKVEYMSALFFLGPWRRLEVIPELLSEGFARKLFNQGGLCKLVSSGFVRH